MNSYQGIRHGGFESLKTCLTVGIFVILMASVSDARADIMPKSALIEAIMESSPTPGSKAEGELIIQLMGHFKSGGKPFRFSSTLTRRFRKQGVSNWLIHLMKNGPKRRLKKKSKAKRSPPKVRVEKSGRVRLKVKGKPRAEESSASPIHTAAGLTVTVPGLGGGGYQPNLGAWFEYADDGLSLGASLDLFSVKAEEGSDSRIDATLLGWVGYQLALDEARRALFDIRLGLGIRAMGSDIQFTGAAGPGIVILVGDDAGAFLRFGVDAYFSTLSRAVDEAILLEENRDEDEIEVTFDFTEVTPSVRFGMYF